jgi:hypothetical protein
MKSAFSSAFNVSFSIFVAFTLRASTDCAPQRFLAIHEPGQGSGQIHRSTTLKTAFSRKRRSVKERKGILLLLLSDHGVVFQNDLICGPEFPTVILV